MSTAVLLLQHSQSTELKRKNSEGDQSGIIKRYLGNK